jgi:hypothetical protein
MGHAGSGAVPEIVPAAFDARRLRDRPPSVAKLRTG